MATMDVFAGTGFDTLELSGLVNEIDTVPQFLGSLGIFTPEPVSTTDIAIDRTSQAVSLIPATTRDAPKRRTTSNPRDLVKLETVPLQDGFSLRASEVMNIRAFGSNSELETATGEFLRRAAKIKRNMELTHENHRLGAIQGKILDADGTTVIYDFYDAFNRTEEAAINFNLNVDTTDVRGKFAQVVRAMTRAAKGAFTGATKIHALAGDDFYDALIAHPKIRDAYLGHVKAQELLNGTAFNSFDVGSCIVHNYQGTDDNSTVAIATNEIKFFPVGAQDFFQKAMAPHDTFELVNTLGLEYYAERQFEREGNPRESRSVDFDLYSYPLYVCQRPNVLRKGVMQ